MHEPSQQQERDRTGQQVDHARQPIAGCADQDHGTTAPGVGQPAHERAEEQGGDGGSAAHQAGFGLTSTKAYDVHGQRGNQHLQAEGIDEVGQRRENEVRGKKAILDMPDNGLILGVAHVS